MKASKIDEIDFAKGNGLVPVVTQEAKTGKVLMLAYANREAVETTMKTKPRRIGAGAGTSSGRRGTPRGTSRR